MIREMMAQEMEKKRPVACVYYNLSQQYNNGMKWDLVAKTVIADTHPQAVVIQYGSPIKF